jgi:hypothetical protein
MEFALYTMKAGFTALDLTELFYKELFVCAFVSSLRCSVFKLALF